MRIGSVVDDDEARAMARDAGKHTNLSMRKTLAKYIYIHICIVYVYIGMCSITVTEWILQWAGQELRLR